MNEIAVFKNVNLGSVRVVERCGEPWFVAKDVLAALGYSEDYNASRALQSVPDEWKGVHRLHTLGGEQDMLTLSEQGLYFFLGRSDKPTALPYQKWIAGDVVPALRKHGTYSVTTAPTNPINMVKGDFIAAVEMAKAIGFDNNQAAFCANNAVKSIHGVDSLALMGISSLEAPTNDRYFTPTELGKMVGISGMAMNKRLESACMQTNDAKKWVATDKGKAYCRMFDTGKKSGGASVQQMKWLKNVLDII